MNGVSRTAPAMGTSSGEVVVTKTPEVPGVTSSVVHLEAVFAELKEQLALDAQRETLATGISSTYHRSAMAVVNNCKA